MRRIHGHCSRCPHVLILSFLCLLSACVRVPTEQDFRKRTSKALEEFQESEYPTGPSKAKPKEDGLLASIYGEEGAADDVKAEEPDAPVESAEAAPSRFPDPRVIARQDGTFTKFFSVISGRGQLFRDLVIKYGDLVPEAVELIVNGDIESYREPNANNPTAAGFNTVNLNVSDWLAVTGTVEEIDRAERFLNLYFASVPQIEIEAKIAEVTTQDIKDLGALTKIFFDVPGKIVEDIDPAADGVQDPLPNFKSFISQIQGSFPAAATTTQGNIVVRKILNDTEIKTTLQLLSSLRNVDIISAPRIAVRNGGRAEIFNGEEIPFVNINNFNPNQSTFTGTVSFKDTGVKLYIIPYLAGSDTIFLNVEAELSLQTGVTDIGGVQNPIIATRNAKTHVHIREGSTFVIGGLVTTQESEFVDKIPLLGDIPLLGMLFRSSFTQKLYTEVLFFITPRVIYPQSGGNTLIVPG